ncbi:MAG: bifunctional diaminohydroxyphosphoribosylaminopyrimidine deaminase/5-amino-6-(5-phosphoribosylamino)uracil reductase RibD [Planctomycetota bacterium]|nr:bifunctional diaminohydroxyphosphoribosylaminopyrimidine deaminase/5-amino-6-(5-phosphoribosylamino)uracil reductase RibD [Planctomycetota bacterium]
MREALELARQGDELVSPNPLVGAVLVRRGRVIARGYYRRFGGDHAEVDVLRRLSDARGADLYVSLEPCGHQGKTPPCAEAIVEAGVRRVFYAAGDPNPLTRGKGPRMLRRAGVVVRGGILRREARELNAPYFHWRESGRPWVLLKWAMSLDGKIATAEGKSRWISGREARAHAHGLRRRADAVLVGTETALRDDPLLTPRPSRGRRPWRVVLDRRARLPLGLRFFRPEGTRNGPRLYVTSRRLGAGRRRQVERRGLEVLVVRERGGGLDLEALLDELGSRGISQLLVEGGGRLAASFLALGLVQEVAAYVAPRLLGGAGAPSPVGGVGLGPLGECPALRVLEERRLGRDRLIRGRIR